MYRIIEIFIGLLIVGLTTFGGGPVFIPLMESLFVSQTNLFTVEEFSTIIAVVSSIPGPTGPKIAGYAMFYEFGILGFILAYLALIIPANIIMIFAYKSMKKLKENPRMEKLTIFIKPVIIGIFLSITINFLIGYADFSSKLNQKNISMLIIFTISFYLIDVKKVKIIYVILLAVTYGLVVTYLM